VTATDLYPHIRAGVVSSGVRDIPRGNPARRKEVAVDQTGRSFPLGATVFSNGVNFSVFSRQAGRVELLLFDRADAALPTRLIELDARRHRTYHYWHTFVPGIRPGQIYAYRASGPFLPEHGLRFDPDKVLLDPYGRAVVVPDAYSRHLTSQRGDNTATAMKSVVLDPGQYDWEGDAPLQRSFAKTVIYEMRCRASRLWTGLNKPNSPAQKSAVSTSSPIDIAAGRAATGISTRSA
jgi:glycogen operon protein